MNTSKEILVFSRKALYNHAADTQAVYNLWSNDMVGLLAGAGLDMTARIATCVS